MKNKLSSLPLLCHSPRLLQVNRASVIINTLIIAVVVNIISFILPGTAMTFHFLPLIDTTRLEDASLFS